MNKQIEEMAKIIHEAKMNDIIAKVTGDIEDLIDCPPMNVSVAEALYNAGYRKTSDVAREIFAEINKIIDVDKFGEAKFDVRELYKIEKKYESEGADDDTKPN